MAEFKTAQSQAILPLDVIVPSDLKRGDFVVYNPTSKEITKATAANITNETATHIVALTDQTISNGYVPTDMRDYRASEKVAASETPKKVGLWPIFDWGDIIPAADGSDHA